MLTSPTNPCPLLPAADPARGSPRLKAYGGAVALPLALVLVLRATAGEHAHYFLFVPVLAVAAYALRAGTRPGLLSAAVAMLATALLVLLEGGSLRSASLLDAWRLVGVTVVSFLVAWACGSLQDAYAAAARDRVAAVELAQQLARKQSEAEQAAQQRDEVVAVVSHDLRAPLATVNLTAQRLERVPDRPEKVRQYAQIIRAAAHRMERLLSDLVDAARLEAGRLPLTRKLEAPDTLVAEALESTRPLAEQRGLQLTCEAAKGLPPVDCDRVRILQVLSNLLGNAVKATPAGGRVVLRLQRVGDEARFEVSDSGPGIPAEDLPHVFERGRRGRSATYDGSGLGLFITRALVEAHGGRVSLESAPGAGTTASFTLPLVRG